MAIRPLEINRYESLFILSDCTGLVVPELAHRKIIDWAYPPGHDKTVDLSYFTSKRPTILRMWSFKDNPPESIMRQTRKALRAWQRDDVRTHYQPDMVKMTPASGEEPPRYVLVLVLGDQPAATAEAWRTYDRMTRQTLAHLREITY